MPPKTVKLEVDPAIFQRKFMIETTSDETPPESECALSRLLNNTGDANLEYIPWKLVRPLPGFCIKTHTLDEGDKVFINICHTDSIPPPKDISDEQLIEIIESEEAPNYTVPLSMGNLHLEVDKTGNMCSVYDVAINTGFLNKILVSELFKTFFLIIVMEGIQTKFNLQLPVKDEKPYVILKNRKAFGALQEHRIQVRPVREETKKKLIEVISSCENPETPTLPAKSSKPLIEVISKGGTKNTLSIDDNNKLRLFSIPRNGDPKLLMVLAKVKALSGADIDLDVSQRRLIISCARNETIDCVLPYTVIPDKAVAQYFVNLQLLQGLIFPHHLDISLGTNLAPSRLFSTS